MKNATIDGYIFSIIQNNQIKEQSELQNKLLEHGHNIPQATLSRKLKKLNIAKVGGVYQIINIEPTTLPIVLKMKVSDFGLIVLHTQPGHAGGLAYYLDKHYVNNPQYADDILGTIAGDDTIVIIMQNQQSVKMMTNLLKVDFPYLT